MDAVELDPLILAFYRDRYCEAERLTRSPHGRLEFLRTLDNAPPDRLADLLPSAVRCARLLERDPALIAACPHLLGVGQV